MPRPHEYTPARRMIGQAIMWAILGGTVLLAAMVTRKQKQLNHLDLGETSVTSGNVSVRLPMKWRSRSRTDEDRRVIAVVAEGNTGEDGREIRIYSEQLDTPVSPLHYLFASFGVTIPGRLEQMQVGIPTLATVEIAGFPGIMLTEHRMSEVYDAEDLAYGKEVYGCVVLPSLQAITVQLTGGDPGDLSDESLVQQVAGAIRVGPAARLEEAGSSITLPDGITLTPPKGCVPVTSKDDLRVDRRIWMTSEKPSELPQRREQLWTAIDVVGCIFTPPTDPKDAEQKERAIEDIQTLLVVRDCVRWRGAQVALDGNYYRIDPPSGHRDFPMRAYLLPDGDSSRALLAVFHGGYDSGDAFDAMWKELAGSVKFLDATSIAQLEDAGTAEASRIRKADWKTLLTERDAQWSLWTDSTDRPHIGWASIEFKPKELAATFESRLRRGGGQITRVTEQWDRKDSTFNCVSQRTWLNKDGDDIDSVRQTVTLKGEQLNVSAQSRIAAIAQYRMPAPPQFVPGAILPLIIGKLAPGPMMLVTDSFPGCQASAAPRPMGVIIRPVENLTRRADADGKPLRCVSCQINGAGTISRWYLDDDGAIAGIELAGGVQCNPSDEKTVGFDFGKDGHMAPRKN